MKLKSDDLDCFKKWQKRVECNTGCKIRSLRSDNGGEYLSCAFEDHLAEHGITHQLTIPYTPQQNGTAERLNRTLINSTRSMLKHMNCEKIFWAEAVTTACYIKNRVTTATQLHTKYGLEREPMSVICGYLVQSVGILFQMKVLKSWTTGHLKPS
jgi:transposase InsO family protein